MSRALRIASRYAPCLALALFAAGAHAQAGGDRAEIAADAGTGASGRIAVNQAAGSGNAQVNLAAIALSADGHGSAAVAAQQRVQPGARERDAAASLRAGAFAGVGGALALNQAAGSGNAQANLLAVGQGGAVIALADDQALAHSVGARPTEGAALAPAGLREARIERGAFAGSQGVVQVNQSAGVGNSATNAIVLQLPGSAYSP